MNSYTVDKFDNNISINNSKPNNRLVHIDLLESIAIFLVLSYHGTNYNFNFLTNTNYIVFIRYFFRSILSCCVPLFFFANGFLLFNRDFNLKKHIIKIIRLTILTFIWAVIDLFILMFIKNEFLSLKEFIKGVWSWKQGWINHSWYMSALIVLYIIFPLLKIAFDTRRDIFYFFLIISTIFTFGNVIINISVSIISHLVRGTNTIYSHNWFNLFNHLRGIRGYTFVYFCLGGLGKEILQKFKFLSKPHINIFIILVSMLSLFIVGLSLTYIRHTYIWDLVWDGYDTIFTLINTICIFALCSQYQGSIHFPRKLLCLISSNTLGIYFIHVLFNSFFKPKILNIAIISNVPGNILYTAVILTLSLCTVLIIKKIPLLKRLVS